MGWQIVRHDLMTKQQQKAWLGLKRTSEPANCLCLWQVQSVLPFCRWQKCDLHEVRAPPAQSGLADPWNQHPDPCMDSWSPRLPWVSVDDQQGAAGSQHPGCTVAAHTWPCASPRGQRTVGRAEAEWGTGEAGIINPKCEFWMEDNLGGTSSSVLSSLF